MEKVNLKEEIKKLIRLQELDKQLYDLNKEKEEKPKILEALQSEFDQTKQILNEFEEKSKALLLKRKDCEGQLATKEEKIKELQNKLFGLKTNKEYSTMLSEINGIKMDSSLLEEQILKIFDEQDGLQKGLEKQKEELKVEESKLGQEKNKITDRIKEIEGFIKDLSAKREVTEKGVDSKIASQYSRILKGKESLALVEVANHSCQGCFMEVPPQVINEIKMNDRLIFCEMCARILYISDETSE
ncbi:zinc ribbon domain-containing protein [Candidatus Omnitrophota bacterium]